MKKWLKRISAALCSLLVLLILGGFYLLGTESGTSFLVHQAEKQLKGALQIGSVSGHLLARLELSAISFADSSVGKLEIGNLLIDWKPADLLHLHLRILEVTIKDCSYTAAAPPVSKEPVPEKPSPLILPELKLPITIDFSKLAIQNFSYFSSADATPLIVTKAELALHWKKDNTIQLQQLDVTMPQASLKLQGQILPLGDYPLRLTSHLQSLDSTLPSLTILGTYEGDLQNLTIHETLSGDADADLQITLQNLLNDLSWDGKLTIEELAPAIFSPDIPGVVQGTLNTRGNLQLVAVTGELSMYEASNEDLNWNGTLNIQANLETMLITVDQLYLNHAKTTAFLALTGTTDADQILDLDLQWQNLQWPLSEEAEYHLAQGEATLTGSMDNYHLTLQTEVAGEMIPTATLQITSDGNTESVNNLTLQATLLEGTFSAEGAVQWAPDIEWQLSSTGTTINPGLHYADWPGNLNWLITSEGTFTENGLISSVMIKNIQGTLRELPVTGKGALTLHPDTITIDDLQISSGSARLKAQGSLAENSKLRWQMDIADFSDLLPDSGGIFKGSGTIQGDMQQPKIDFQIQGSSLAFSGVRLEQIESNAALDLSWTSPFSIELHATDIKTDGTLIPHLAIQAKGSREQHTLHFSANHEMADITLACEGGYLDEKWQGVLDTLTIQSTDIGIWQLDKPARLNAATAGAAMETFCLKRENAHLCVAGSWEKENSTSSAAVDLNGFPLSWLSPWYPETLKNLSGDVSLHATANMADALQAEVSAVITPGIIDYATLKNVETLSHEGMHLDLHVVENGLDADFRISVDSNSISGNLHSPDLLKTDTKNTAKLTGSVFIDAKNFALVESLLPDVENIDAVIAADFKVQGTLEHPDINGTGKLNIAQLLIPAAGLELSDTVINLMADNTDLKLNGIFNSPKGSLILDGKMVLDSSHNWPARFTLKGDNFRIMNLPDMQIFLSSDLLLTKESDKISLSGTATIPQAEILLRELSKGAETASPDVVIIQDMQEKEQRSPMHMDLKISLGKKVHFAGFGLNAYIDGQLTIQSEPGEQMLGSGAFHIKQGSFRAYGQDLTIETGVISFPGGPLSQPGINLRATRTEGDILAGIYAIGPVAKPRLTTFSNPPMSESHIISYLLTGASPENVGKGAKVSIGRQINNKLSVAVGTDVKTGDSEFITRYRLNRRIHVETTTGSDSNAADLFYTIELGEEGSSDLEDQTQEY